MVLCFKVCWGSCNLQFLFHTETVNVGLSALEAEAVEAINHTDHVDVPVSTPAPETTSSSEPEPKQEETTPALETANEE